MHKEEKKKNEISANTFNNEIIFDIISLYTTRLAETPEDTAVLTRLAYAYEALGEHNREMIVWKRIYSIDSGHKEAKRKLNVK